MTLFTTLKDRNVQTFNIIPEVKNPPSWINSSDGVIVHPSQRTVDEGDVPSFEFDVYTDYKVAKVKTWPAYPGIEVTAEAVLYYQCTIGSWGSPPGFNEHMAIEPTFYLEKFDHLLPDPLVAPVASINSDASVMLAGIDGSYGNHNGRRFVRKSW